MATAARTLLVIDLSTLELRRRGRHVRVLRADGAQLCRVRVRDDESPRATVHRALRAALGAPVAVAGADGLHDAEVALYNPATALIAVAGDGRIPVVYGDGRPVALPVAGSPATLADDRMQVGSRQVPLRDEQTRSVLAELAAHRLPVAA